MTPEYPFIPEPENKDIIIISHLKSVVTYLNLFIIIHNEKASLLCM